VADVIVVGVDDSENAWHALDWAVDEAKLRGATLRIVCAFESPVTSIGLGTAFGAGTPITVDPEDLEGAARDVVDKAVQRVAKAVPVEVVAKCDRPDDVLLEQSAGAVMLVVGSRGHSAVGSLLLGSVSNHVVHHATCPVVVVPHAE
jgi:nucleotide-binding universal stress UspA family protein